VLSRFLRIFNVSIGVLLLAAAIAVYWYAFRPLPKTSGSIVAPIHAPATVRRDARGVPHIKARSWQDAVFLQGFVTAQDRLWQMDALRRFGAGELAEVFGPAAIIADQQTRSLRMRALAEADMKSLRPVDREVLLEYARGVNFYIETHRGNYPVEFSLPGHAYDPRPWRLTDSLIAGLVMFEDLTNSSGFDLSKTLLLIQNPNLPRLRLLFPPVQGQAINPGSNAWAVSGAHSQDGTPLVANDPHLSYKMPGTWHLVDLQAPGLHVSGAALPGVPCVITGHNEQIAWGVTNLQADVADIYLERINEANGQYISRGTVEQAKLDREVIRVRGGKPVEFKFWVTRHGPVSLHANGRSFAVKWSAADGFAFPFFDVDRAQNWQDFRAALHDFWGPGQNFVYADRDGNIGYQATGHVPIRRGFDGDIALDGASGRFEWDGYIPFEQLPWLLNPPSGIVETSNQNPFPNDYPVRIDGSFADRFRSQQARALLTAKPKLNIDDMLSIQKDVYSAYDHFLAQQLIAVCAQRGSSDPLVREAVNVLKGWDGQMDKDQAAPMITQLFSTAAGAGLVNAFLQARVLTSVQAKPEKSPEKTGGRPLKPAGEPQTRVEVRMPDILPRPQVIEAFLKVRPTGWVGRDDWDAWVLNTFSEALRYGRDQQGSPVSTWKWGRRLEWNLVHPVGRQLPLVDGFFNIGRVAMSGSGTTVKQTTATLGPSERMVADVGNWDKSVQNLLIGESGNVASPHYKDQWAAYYVGKSFPMEFEHVDAKEVLEVRPAH
jgi:penicillin amidase